MAAISQEDAAVVAQITEPEALRMASTIAPIQETKTGGGGGKLVVHVDHTFLDYTLSFDHTFLDYILSFDHTFFDNFIF